MEKLIVQEKLTGWRYIVKEQIVLNFEKIQYKVRFFIFYTQSYTNYIILFHSILEL